MTRLDRLEVNSFRGIVHSSLPFDGGSVVLGGANGTGKTAFIDALEFLYTGSIATLSGTAGLGLRQHGAHIHADPRDTAVTGYFEDPEGSATRWLAGQFESPASLDDHIVRGSRVTFILRRSQLQGFIHAKPADRYRSLAELIGLERLDTLQSVTRRAADFLQREVIAAESELHLLEASTDGDEDIPDEAALLAGLNGTLEDLGLNEYRLESLDEIARVRAALLRSVSDRTPDPRLQARAELARALERGSHERLRDALASYVEMAPNSRDGGDRGEMLEMLGLLSRGRDILRRRPDSHTCPLCESEINVRGVLSDLIRRVGKLEEVGLLQQRLDRARDDLEASLIDAAGRVRALQAAAAGAEVPGTVLETLANSITMLRESIRAGATAQTLDMAGRLESALDRYALWSTDTAERLRPVQPNGDGGDEATSTVSAALSALERAGVLRAAAARAESERRRRSLRHTELNSILARRRHAASLAGTVSSTFTSVRNEEIQRLFDDLRADLVRFYETLHPGEGYQALSIAMDPKKRGSTDLRLDFFDRNEQDPRAFASEGHLDSLGLCIFLAFVRRFNGDWPLLVLDDVVASVDAAHKARVARLLFEEFGDHQLFVTTHDGRWFNEIRRVQGELGITNVQNLVIEDWSLENGPSIRSAA